MDEKIRIVTPRYQQIAADVAAKIVDGHYKVGEKIYTRSSLASQYGVSPETARRAIAILADLKIVETVRGSGVTILSYENAVQFVKQFRGIKSAVALKKEISNQLDRQIEGARKLRESLVELMDRVEKVKTINPFVPFETVVEEGSFCESKTISQVNFWHNTGATIVGILQEEVLIMSPGPHAVLSAGNTVYFVGDENALVRVEEFLNKEEKANG